MHNPRRAFSLVELAVVVVVLGLLVAVLTPMARRARQGDQLYTSLSNMRKIIQGTQHYRYDHAGRVPMRACGYSLGQVAGGWDTWNVGGKNCSSYWTSGSGVFDEPAYFRFLNPYVYGGPINPPTGFTNGGSGSTWTFSHGHPLPADRANLQTRTFQSPGDAATWQRTWPSPTPGVSGYDDIGTSYELNMKWWTQVFSGSIPGVSGNFTNSYLYGAQHIATAFDTSPDFVFMTDQIAEVVADTTLTIPGEFGGNNMSVVGYADGRAAYIPIVSGAISGPGYTFGLPGLLTATPVPSVDELP